jgi:hypothetical protein
MLAPGVVLYALTVTHCPELSEVMLLPVGVAEPMVVPFGEAEAVAAGVAAGRAALKTAAALMVLFAEELMVLFAEKGDSPGLVEPLHAASTSTEAASPACHRFVTKTIPYQVFGTAGRAAVRGTRYCFYL